MKSDQAVGKAQQSPTPGVEALAALGNPVAPVAGAAAVSPGVVQSTVV